MTYRGTDPQELAVTTSRCMQPISAERAIAVTHGKNYNVSVSGKPVEIKRDVDFGVIPGTKKPSLYKPGAEKIVMAYNLMQRYTIESAVEEYNGERPFFFYRVRCDLIMYWEGKEYILSNCVASANTLEKRNGGNSPFNSANTALKMAEKRALVGAAIAISGLSDVFTQDIENEDFMANASTLTEQKPTDPLTRKQIQRLFAIAADNGYSGPQAKVVLQNGGFESTKTIQYKDYDKACELFENQTKSQEE